jgi:hypothetical protein
MWRSPEGIHEDVREWEKWKRNRGVCAFPSNSTGRPEARPTFGFGLKFFKAHDRSFDTVRFFSTVASS